MGEEEIGEDLVVLQAVTQCLHCRDAHPVVTHKYLLNVRVLLQGFGNGADLLIRQDIFDQVQISQRKQLE